MNLRTPQTPNERLAVAALQQCGFAPASWDKRFVRQLAADTLTDKERPQVWRLFIRYRRQIVKQTIQGVELDGKLWQELMATAQEKAAPDFRKLAAARNTMELIAQARQRREAQG